MGRRWRPVMIIINTIRDIVRDARRCALVFGFFSRAVEGEQRSDVVRVGGFQRCHVAESQFVDGDQVPASAPEAGYGTQWQGEDSSSSEGLQSPTTDLCVRERCRLSSSTGTALSEPRTS